MTSLIKLFQTSSILYPLLLLLFLNSSCIQEDYDTSSHGADTSVELSIRSNAVSAADENKLFNKETAIHSIRVLTFDRYNQAGVAAFEKNQYAVKESVAGDGGFTETGGIYKVKMSVQEHANKEFYVLVNEPAALKDDLDAITSVSELHTMQYTLATYFSETLANAAICFTKNQPKPTAPFSHLPMFGKALQQSVLTNAAGVVTNTIPVDVSRSLARVDLKLKKETGTSSVIKLKNSSTTFAYTTYAQGNLTDASHTTVGANQSSSTKIFNAGSDIEITAGETDAAFAHVLSFYTPARSCAGANEKIKITLGNIEYGGKTLAFEPIILDETAAGAITEIKQNTVYEVKGTIKNNAIDVSVELLPWISKDIETDIGGGESYIHAPSTVLMNYFDNNSYTKTVTYSGSHEVAIVVGGVEVKYDAANTSLVSAGGALPVWLTAATWTQTDAKSGDLTFTYQMSGETSTPFDIALKSGTVTRKMLVKYADSSLRLYSTVDAEEQINRIDYARFTDEATGKRGSFTGKLYYSGTIEINLTTPSPAFPSWLTRVEAGEEGSGASKRQYIKVTYKPTAAASSVTAPSPTGHPKYSINIRDARGDVKAYTLVYDNGFITPEIMKAIEDAGNFKQVTQSSTAPATGVHNRNNWAPNGFHFARRGWQGHDGTTRSGQLQNSASTLTGGIDPLSSNMLAHATLDAKAPWQVSAVDIAEMTNNDYTYNQGEKYTNILIGRHNSNPTVGTHQHWVAKYCEKTGEGYYLPGVSDLKWIYHYANLYLGSSYTFSSSYYWSTTEHFGGYGWFVDFGSDRVHNSLSGNSYGVRCVRDL
jgi:hypothetical protein